MADKSEKKPAATLSSQYYDNTADHGEIKTGAEPKKIDSLDQMEGGNNNAAAVSEGIVEGQVIPQESQASRQLSLPGAFRVTPGISLDASMPASPDDFSTDEDNSINDPEDLVGRDTETSNEDEASNGDDRFHENNFQVEATLVVEPPIYEAQRISPPEDKVSARHEVVESKKEPTRPFFTFTVFGRRFSFSKRFCLLATLTAVVLVGVAFAAVLIKSNKNGPQPSQGDLEDLTDQSEGETNDPIITEPNEPIDDGRFDDIRPTIAQLSGSEVLEDMESPQYKALDWIANKDGANVPIWDSLRIVQRYILAVIYYSTGGEEWTDNYSFLTDSHECEWSDETGTLGVDGCDEDYVTSLDFSENNLDGTFPTEIGHLTNLTSFRSLGNNITGTIPTEFGLLTDMAFFSLVRNENLKGHIPSELGNFQSAIGFWLNANSLSGSIPSELGQLTSAMFFGLRDNDLTGEIPTSLANIKEGLISFEMHMNKLNGSAEFFCENITGDFILRADKSDVSCSCCGCCD